MGGGRPLSEAAPSRGIGIRRREDGRHDWRLSRFAGSSVDDDRRLGDWLSGWAGLYLACPQRDVELRVAFRLVSGRRRARNYVRRTGDDEMVHSLGRVKNFSPLY